MMIQTPRETWKRLRQAFVDDHRVMTRGIRDLSRCLGSENWPDACKVAQQLDNQLGPHIDFEESHLYPIVRSERGDDYAGHLLDEHLPIRDLLLKIEALQPVVTPTNEQRERWMVLSAEGLEHATSCGTLLSHL